MNCRPGPGGTFGWLHGHEADAVRLPVDLALRARDGERDLAGCPDFRPVAAVCDPHGGLQELSVPHVQTGLAAAFNLPNACSGEGGSPGSRQCAASLVHLGTETGGEAVHDVRDVVGGAVVLDAVIDVGANDVPGAARIGAQQLLVRREGVPADQGTALISVGDVAFREPCREVGAQLGRVVPAGPRLAPSQG